MPYLVLLLPLLLLLTSCASTPVSTSRSDDAVIEIPRSSQVRESDEMYLVLLGELAGKTGDLETATHPAIAERATRIALFARDYPGALEAARYWEALAPDSLDAKQIIAVLYARFGELEKAILYFETIILATRDVHGGAFEHVSTLLSQDVPKQNALTVMRTIADRSPDDYRAEYAFASLASRFGAYGPECRVSPPASPQGSDMVTNGEYR